MHWFDPFDAHLLETILRNLIRNVMCDSCYMNLLHLERDLNSSGLSLKKAYYQAPSPTQYCIMDSNFQNDFIDIMLFWRQFGVAEKNKIRLESGNLNCSLVSSTRC